MAGPRQCRNACEGFTYVELCVSIVIFSICVIASTKAVHTVLGGQRRIETQYELSLIAQDKVDTALHSLRDNLGECTEEGNLAAYGHPGWRHRSEVFFPAGSGGLYAQITVWTWADEDGDTQRDTGEPQVRFDTLSGRW